MASVVDTSVKHFLSTMANAPVLNGTAGSLIALLDALLVNGFDTKAVTSLTVSGGVAQANFSGSFSGITDSVIVVAGVTGGATALNGEQKITAVGAGYVRFATAVADGTASGTISIKMAPAGWTKAFSGTNLAAYKSADPASVGHYLRVDDTNAQFARVVGYESMSDVNTGTGPFPTAAQMSGGGYWPKSIISDSTAVAWSLAADARLFYLSTQPGSSSNSLWQIGNVRSFGEPIALRPSGDAFSTILNYSTSSATASMYDACMAGTVQSRIASPRNHTGLGSAVLQDLFTWGGSSGSISNYSGIESSHGPFPNPVDGALYLLKKRVTAGSVVSSPRADVPGLYHIPQSGVWDTIRSGDRLPGTGGLAGRWLVAFHGATSTSFNTVSTSPNTAVAAVDVTGPWRN